MDLALYPRDSRARGLGIVYLAAVLVSLAVLHAGPARVVAPDAAELPLILLGVLHFLFGARLVLPAGRLARRRMRRFVRVPEFLFSATLALFIFSYLFALNANLEYVQRFIISGGDLAFAVDSETERSVVLLRYLPLLVADVVAFVVLRLAHYRLAALETRRDPIVGPWRLGLTLVSVFLATFALPSFVSIDGIPALGWLALVPLFVVLRRSRFSSGVFYLVVFGTLHSTLVNYWLGTFSLVSLQVSMVILFLFYLIFAPLVMGALKLVRAGRGLVLPLGWTFFELARSSGFLGYPWGLAAHSQWANLPLIQVASLTGVWGVSFLLLLANSALAELVLYLIDRGLARRSETPFRPAASAASSARSVAWLVCGTTVLVATAVFAGGLALTADSQQAPAEESVRVALIQQNSDPRKHDYSRTLDSLVRLTDQALEENPDLVAWSETAFVPNIRRWSQEDPERSSLARVVRSMLDYLEGIDTWLLTGNDDYDRVLDEDGDEVARLNYNAAILFSDEAERMETYHKVRLVPFTEYFPYQDTFPWVYELLLNFDVNFWEPGDERTVFEHPKLSFVTPICFEDVFPDDLRRFVLRGPDVILNLSNDYWSLDPVEAKQHFVASLFRAVENRRPLLRSTASGLTAHVDEYGRILASAPYFEEAFVIADVELRDRPFTFYTRYGDWLPWAALVALILILWVSLARRLLDRPGGVR